MGVARELKPHHTRCLVYLYTYVWTHKSAGSRAADVEGNEADDFLKDTLDLRLAHTHTQKRAHTQTHREKNHHLQCVCAVQRTLRPPVLVMKTAVVCSCRRTAQDTQQVAACNDGLLGGLLMAFYMCVSELHGLCVYINSRRTCSVSCPMFIYPCL